MRSKEGIGNEIEEFTRRPTRPYSKKREAIARTCNWRAVPTGSRELTASKKENIEFRMNRQEKIVMTKNDMEEEEDGFLWVADVEDGDGV